MLVVRQNFCRYGARLSLVRLWVAVLLCGCAAEAPLLNSEQIEARYGSYDVRVLQQDERKRVSSLASEHGERRITRTLAITLFAEPADALAAETRLIRNGASIGSTFRQAGWHIEKHTIYAGPFDVAEDLQIVARLMGIALPAQLALHAYRFDVQRDGDSHAFATILELHHPGYISVADLKRDYGTSADRADREKRSIFSLVAATLHELNPPGGPLR